MWENILFYVSLSVQSSQNISRVSRKWVKRNTNTENAGFIKYYELGKHSFTMKTPKRGEAKRGKGLTKRGEAKRGKGLTKRGEAR